MKIYKLTAFIKCNLSGLKLLLRSMLGIPGFKDTEDAEFIDEMMNVLGDEVLFQKAGVFHK